MAAGNLASLAPPAGLPEGPRLGDQAPLAGRPERPPGRGVSPKSPAPHQADKGFGALEELRSP